MMESDKTRHRVSRRHRSPRLFLLRGNSRCRRQRASAQRRGRSARTYRVTRAKDVGISEERGAFKVFRQSLLCVSCYVSVLAVDDRLKETSCSIPRRSLMWSTSSAISARVGVDLKDLKYILLSHGHLDHFGGAARISQNCLGARVAAIEDDWKNDRNRSEAFRAGTAPPPPRVPKRDWCSRKATRCSGRPDAEIHQHPGHTPGVLFDGRNHRL